MFFTDTEFMIHFGLGTYMFLLLCSSGAPSLT